MKKSIIKLQPELRRTSILPSGILACAWVFYSIILQCTLIFIGASTISFCVWAPESHQHDYDKLARIMYLYDPHACGYNLRSSSSIKTLQLENNTMGLMLRPIAWKPPVMTVSTRLSAKTRKYIHLSVVVHVVWLLVAVVLRLFRSSTSLKTLKFILTTSFFGTVFVVLFDLSMAIVYIAHIQQSLTSGMILRYSGWGVEMKLKRYNNFGGWLPMVASACWMRGIIILGLNIYSCRVLQVIRRRIKKREETKMAAIRENLPIPDPIFGQLKEHVDKGVLYYRSGDYRAAPKNPNRPSIFFL